MAKVSVYNMEGKEVGNMDLNDAVFGVEINEHLVHMATLETERNWSCKTGFNKISAVDWRWYSIRSSTKRLFFQIKQERKESSFKICFNI